MDTRPGVFARVRRPRRGTAGTLIAFALALLTLVTGAAAVEDGRRQPGRRLDERAGTSARRTARAPRRLTLQQPRIVGPPRMTVDVYPGQVGIGDRFFVTVRLTGTGRTARSAAFHVGTDPQLVRFVGFQPTGRGALMVAPSDLPGDVVVYRSSLPEGFAQTEEIVVLEFEGIGTGESSVAIQEARLMDGRARGLSLSYESGSVICE